jgi:hypothetical protein
MRRGNPLIYSAAQWGGSVASGGAGAATGDADHRLAGGAAVKRRVNLSSGFAKV